MAQNLATIGGKPAVAFYGEVPWRRLGQKLDKPATAALAPSGLAAATFPKPAHIARLWTSPATEPGN